ncbi:hypothetical protein RSP822_18065 [Ralstonia solanacearum]|uniref:hypothetical protein n=1 Tax=Ralstonia solanacearum TaxID=305 RepID=UPI000E673F97|nr:hypothetical protein [Ralstonia solanacearum]RIJ84976.1 hypothetical protein RSP822_18065 [Ralstonia solanacearum]
MKTIELKGWIYALVWDYSDHVSYEFSDRDYEALAARGGQFADIYVQYKKLEEHVITVDVPEVDVHATKLAALETERTALRAAFQMKLNEINERISKLQALPFSAAESAGA